MAMENGGLSATDALLLGNGGGFGGLGNGFEGLIYLAVIMAMFGGGGFGWGGNNGNSNAIQNDINRGFDNQNLQAQTRDILSSVNAGTAQAVAATNQSFHDNLAAMQSLYNETARDIAALAVGQANLQASQSACCCDTKQLIQQVASTTDAQIARNNYDAAMRDAATNANFTAQIQSVKDMIAQNKIESLQSQISQLQLQNATANVLRYPNQWTYNGGFFPPMQCGCGCNA